MTPVKDQVQKGEAVQVTADAKNEPLMVDGGLLLGFGLWILIVVVGFLGFRSGWFLMGL